METNLKYNLIAFIPFVIFVIVFIYILYTNWDWIVYDPVLKVYGIFILLLLLGMGIVFWLGYFLNKEDKTPKSEVKENKNERKN